MMRLLLITILALSQAFGVLSQHTEAAFQLPTSPSTTCEEQARQSGFPTDGWEVHDDGGQIKCRRVTVQELGLCSGVEYIDAPSRTPKTRSVVDMSAKLAKCCAKDHVWTFDNGDGPTRGGCCMVGLHMHNGKCIPPYTPPPPRCPSETYLINGKCTPITASPPRCPSGTFLQDGVCIPVTVPTCPVGTYLDNDQCLPIIASPAPRCPSGTFLQDGIICPIGTRIQDGQCVQLPQTCGNGHNNGESSCACTNYPVCGHGRYLGIKYGRCYILSFSDGQQLGTVRENTMYVKGGFFDDIPFKVCKSTNDCSRGKEVEMDEFFYLQDQHGLYGDLKSTKGWIDNAHNGDHLSFTFDVNKAGKFTGTPTCAGSECGIQLRGGPDNGGMGLACPMATPGVTFWSNPKVTCDEYEVPLTSGIYSA
ncbi:uncharacterized protein EDB93DRAFT_1101536 [Suillus bovinus]|uniref:uncharacterized protein n=1 Tax=Suillus bovinus TaxID=48563 RepID=UPI001B86210B|nr:uncharacterized protein EDB93DRAFT_1101536 [Suillus bovinus]KAG2156684.1 hypothetical protein EDB93DRAFT_1101536 [Suillus bovinus]